MFIQAKQMRKAGAPVPPHVLAIAEKQREAMYQRVETQSNAPATLVIEPVAPRKRIKPSNRKRSI